MFDLKRSDFWRRYVPFWNPDTPVGFREIEHQRYLIDGLHVRSMLSSLELTLLYGLARDYWSGVGEIVDTGCLYGLTSRCFAEGILANKFATAEKKFERIFSYDLFLAEDYDFYASDSKTFHSGSLLPDFIRLNQKYLNQIVPCAGDFMKMRWGSKPIEILMIDAAKSWELNHAHVSRLFPHLLPGRSIVIQQDYLNWHEYWTILTMEYFANKFELQQVVYGCSAVFLCTAPIEQAEANEAIGALPTDRKISLLMSAISKAPAECLQAMKCALASLLIDEGRIESAGSVIDVNGGDKMCQVAA